MMNGCLSVRKNQAQVVICPIMLESAEGQADIGFRSYSDS